MNILDLQRERERLEDAIKSASRTLFELEISQAKREKKDRLGKTYKSVGTLMSHIRCQVRKQK